MALTLHMECSLRPRFLSAPGFGSRIAFADVAQHRIRQSELLDALAHLFNLRFYTEEATRRVWIEPEGEFFGAGPETDWSGRTDFSQPVERRPVAPEIHEVRTWRYRDGDGAEVRFAQQVTGLERRDGRLAALRVMSPDGTYTLPAEHAVLAVGHSARDTIAMLRDAGMPMEP